MNIFNLSFGKDSMVTLILAAEQGIQIDRVMYCDIRFSPELSGEHPLMAAWIPTAEQRLKELFGVTVDHTYSGVSFYEQFYFDILAEMEQVSVNTFRAEGVTLKEIAEKFSAGYIPTRRKKRLSYVQLDMFDMIEAAGVSDFQGDSGV